MLALSFSHAVIDGGASIAAAIDCMSHAWGETRDETRVGRTALLTAYSVQKRHQELAKFHGHGGFPRCGRRDTWQRRRHERAFAEQRHGGSSEHCSGIEWTRRGRRCERHG